MVNSDAIFHAKTQSNLKIWNKKQTRQNLGLLSLLKLSFGSLQRGKVYNISALFQSLFMKLKSKQLIYHAFIDSLYITPNLNWGYKQAMT